MWSAIKKGRATPARRGRPSSGIKISDSSHDYQNNYTTKNNEIKFFVSISLLIRCNSDLKGYKSGMIQKIKEYTSMEQKTRETGLIISGQNPASSSAVAYANRCKLGPDNPAFRNLISNITSTIQSQQNSSTD